jgi:hypothetical protein
MGKYRFDDDPLSSPGGFAPSDATIRIRQGPVRLTLNNRPVRKFDNELWNMPPPPQNPTRDQKHSLILQYDAVFTHAIERTARSWHICARNIGSAYETAVKGHRDALNKADKSSTALSLSAMWSAVSVLATGGVSFCFGKDLASTAQSVGKDMSTATTSALGNVGPAISAFFTDPPDGVTVEPQTYQNRLENWIDQAAYAITDWSDAFLVREIPRWSETQWRQYDVNMRRIDLAYCLDKVRAIRGMKEVSGQTIEEMAKTLEKSFWMEWIFKVCSQANAVPGAVADRLDTPLGILKEAGTTISGFWNTLGDVPVIGILSAAVGHTSTQEDQKLLAWAKKFKANFDKSAWSKLAA